MIKKLAAHIGKYKKQAILSPLVVTLESFCLVRMEKPPVNRRLSSARGHMNTSANRKTEKASRQFEYQHRAGRNSGWLCVDHCFIFCRSLQDFPKGHPRAFPCRPYRWRH